MKLTGIVAIAITLTAIGAGPPAGAADASKEKRKVEALAKVKKCDACHTMDTEVNGPSYKSIAKLYKPTDYAVVLPRVAEKIRNGGAEHWGPNVMPPAEVRGIKITATESRALARWVLAQ